MKSIESFILEKLKVAKSKPGDCTLEEFLVWYYFDNTQPIEDLQFDEFCCTDFDPTALEEYFDNDNRKLYNFLMDHLDDEIKLRKHDEAGYMYYIFSIDNIEFMPQCNEGEFKKK